MSPSNSGGGVLSPLGELASVPGRPRPCTGDDDIPTDEWLAALVHPLAHVRTPRLGPR